MTSMEDDQQITTSLVINRVSMGPTVTSPRPRCLLTFSRAYVAEKLQGSVSKLSLFVVLKRSQMRV